MALNFVGLEEREKEKDKIKSAIAAQQAANREWDRRQLETSRMGLKNKLVEMALERSFIGTNNMVSPNGKDNKTNMTNLEAREALIKNYKVENDKGELVDDDKFLAAISRIDGTKDPQGFIKLYSVLNPYITAMKKDDQDRTFIGDSVRREVIDIVNRASIVGPDLDRPNRILKNIENALGDSGLEDRFKNTLALGIDTGGSFNITEEPVYTPKPKVEDITKFEEFVVKPVRSRAAAEKSRIFSLLGSLAKSEETGIMGPDGKPLTDLQKTELQNWYSKRIKDIERAETFAEKEKNFGLLASLYSSQFLQKALDQYGNMNRVKELIDPNILNSAKTPIYVPSIEIAKILQNSGILFEGDIIYLTDEAKMARMPKK